VNLKNLLDRLFLTHGRLFHHERILCWFPKYLEHFVDTEEAMMNKEDVLPITWKYYISIMAVSCYDCEYLLKILEEQFLLFGGDVSWLTEGLKAIDRKLRRISELNELMAYRPWIIDYTHIESIAKGEDQKINWSISEIL
jgi:sestrin